MFAFADALRVEYEAIASAGLILQIDDAWLPAHATNTIEHPELVSQRIQRFAVRVGRESVIAGTERTDRGRHARESDTGLPIAASPSCLDRFL